MDPDTDIVNINVTDPINHKENVNTSTHVNSKQILKSCSRDSTLDNENIMNNNNNNNINNNDDDSNSEDDQGFPIFKPFDGPYPWSTYKKDYIQVKNEILVGIVVGCAQIPESVAFSFIAGVEPNIGLHAAWIIGLIVSLTGNRPGLISGATGAMAAILMDPIKQHGVIYLFYTVILKGIIQTVVSFMGFEKIANLVPFTTNIGFVNGLAIIIGTSQINNFQLDNQFVGSGKILAMIILSVLTFSIIEIMPKFTKVVPSSLVAITVATLIEHVLFRGTGITETILIGDVSKLSGGFPKFIFSDPEYKNDLPSLLDSKTWEIITPPAILTALVGMIECVMTIEVIDDLSQTPHLPVTQQLASAGVANFISGFFGTMGGGATIGLSMICIHSGANGRYRISGVVAALFLLTIILVASPLLEAVPTSALVGVMLVVVVHTFEWNSLFIVLISMMPQKARLYLANKISGFRKFENFTTDKKISRSDAIVIVAVTVLTLIFDLAISVIFGVLFSSAWYVWQHSKQCKITSQIVDQGGKDEVKIYFVDGPLFFGNAHWLRKQFRFRKDPNNVEMHLTDAHIYDYSAMQALNFVGEKYKKLGKKLKLKNVNRQSLKLISKAKDLFGHFEYESVVAVETNYDLKLTSPARLNVSTNDRA